MRIVVDLINFPQSGGAEYDWRYTMWIAICKELQKIGHKIWSYDQTGVKNSPFPKYKEGTVLDYYICHTPYGHKTRINRRELFLKHKKPVTCYDHGWLPKTLVVDRKKLFGDSYYYDIIGEIIKECPDLDIAEKIRQKMLGNNISKRAQVKVDLIPDVKYIFVPGQVLHDASVVNYSTVGMKDLITRTLEFATKHNLHVVYKPHPGTLNLKTHGKQELVSFREELKKKYKNFHVVNTSIFDLMLKAVFTSCVNSGSIIDNIVSLTPVYCCGKSFFSKSDTVIYDPDVEAGLSKMFKKDYDSVYMKKQQLRMLWWLNDNLIQEKMSIQKQIKLLEKHSGVTF